MKVLHKQWVRLTKFFGQRFHHFHSFLVESSYLKLTKDTHSHIFLKAQRKWLIVGININVYQSKVLFSKIDSTHPPFPSWGFNDCHLPSCKLIVKRTTYTSNNMVGNLHIGRGSRRWSNKYRPLTSFYQQLFFYLTAK